MKSFLVNGFFGICLASWVPSVALASSPDAWNELASEGQKGCQKAAKKFKITDIKFDKTPQFLNGAVILLFKARSSGIEGKYLCHYEGTNKEVTTLVLIKDILKLPSDG